VVGCGYVGLTAAVCLAERGLDTVSVDVDATTVSRLSEGFAVIDEPLLPELLRAGLSRGLLRFSTDYATLADRDVVFVCVPTPGGDDGSADLREVESAVDRLVTVLRPGAVIALKSTVPVGTTTRIAGRLQHTGIGVVAAPEFLRQGRAVHDFRSPDRLVIGAAGDAEAGLVWRAYRPGAEPMLRMSPESAELTKYASNAFLAMKLSYVNSLAELCVRVGADIGDVTAGMGVDDRIGPHFLQPGPGWGGPCLPKDTAALMHTAHTHGVALPEVEAARSTNASQAVRVSAALQRGMTRPLTSARITALGLTFKAATSDARDSPALAICARLAAAGAKLCGYDPQLHLIDPRVLRATEITAVDDPYLAAKSADAILVLTEWPQFGELDWAAIAEQAPAAVVVDTRNVLDPAVIGATGLVYIGNGVQYGY